MKLFQYSVYLIIILVASISTQLQVFGLDESSRIDSNPPQIRFKIPDYRTSSLPTYSLELTSNVNLENISSSVSTFIPIENGKIWVPADQVTVRPSVFSIFKGVPRILNISFILPNQSASYLGTLTIASNDGYTKKIPTEISVYESYTLYSLAAVTTGVIIAFIIKYTKLRMGTRSIVMESVDRSRVAYSKAISEGRADDSLMAWLVIHLHETLFFSLGTATWMIFGAPGKPLMLPESSNEKL